MLYISYRYDRVKKFAGLKPVTRRSTVTETGKKRNVIPVSREYVASPAVS